MITIHNARKLGLVCSAMVLTALGYVVAHGLAEPDPHRDTLSARSRAALLALRQAHAGKVGLYRIITDRQYCTGGASLPATAVAHLLTRGQEDASDAFGRAAVLLIIATGLVVLVGAGCTLELRTPFWKGGWFPAAGGMIITWLLLSVLANGAAGAAAASSTALAAIALFLYKWAREHDALSGMVGASVALAACATASATGSAVYASGICLMHLADERARHGWRAGLLGVVTICGVVAGIFLWCQDWVPGYDNSSTRALLINMAGVAMLMLWIALFHRPGRSVQRTLALVGPATLLALLWLSSSGNGAAVVPMVTKLSRTSASAGAMYNDPGSVCAALVLGGVLLLSSITITWRRWPGLVVLVITLLLGTAIMAPRDVHHIALICLLAGVMSSYSIDAAVLVGGPGVKERKCT